MNKLRIVALLIPILFSVACASDYLRSHDYRKNEQGFALDEQSKIPDTAEHRAVLDVLARYRSALIKKDVGTIRSLVSNDYYENSGTTDTTADDYGAPDLPNILELLSQHTNDIKYDVTVKDVAIDGNTANVDYEYQYAYHFFVDGKPAWDAGIEVNRLKLVKSNDVWKIVSGL